MPPPLATPDYYAILEVAQCASDQEINAAYRRLARIHHPDKNLGDEEAATTKFQNIHAAFEILSNPSKRRTYDWSYKPTPSTARDPALPPRQHNCCNHPHPSAPHPSRRRSAPRPYNPDYDPDGSFHEVPDSWGSPAPPLSFPPTSFSTSTSTSMPETTATFSRTERGAPEPWENAEDPALYGDPDGYWNPEARRKVQAEHAARQRAYEREVEEEWGGMGGGGDVFDDPSTPPPPPPQPRIPSLHASVSGFGGGIGIGIRQDPVDWISDLPPLSDMWGEERFLGEESRDVYDPCNPFGHGGGGDERQSPA